MKVIEHEHPLELVDLQPPKIVDIWEEESDNDDDDDLIIDEFRRPCNRCHQNITVYHRYYYKCTIKDSSYDFFLHKFCAELPPVINHISDPHPLHLREAYGSYKCDICESEISKDEVYYECSTCFTVIDSKCAVDVEKKSIHHPGHPHVLVCNITRSILCHCNACGKEHKGVFFHCTTCSNFAIHSDCAFLPKKLLIQEATDDAFYHPHPLTISYSFPFADQKANFYPRCRVCNNDFWHQQYRWNYKCEKCMYYAHLDCATSRRKPKTRKYIKNYKDADYPHLMHLPFDDQTCSILKTLFFKKSGPTDFAVKEVNLWHVNHRHQLILVDTLGGASSSKTSPSRIMCHDPMKKIELLCNGCVKPITEMPFYTCSSNEEEDESCNFVLHEWCTRLPASIENHPGHPQHTLHLLPNVPHNFFSIFSCAMCSFLCNGFAYGCVECEYYVDVSCGFIPEKITHKAHPNHLLSRQQLYDIDDLDLRCRLCRSRMFEDDFSFSCSICYDDDIHLGCALLLPGTIRHKYDKHPMSLSYFPIENHKSEYFCEICEEQMNPHCCFYHCHECVQSVHSACAPLILRSETAMDASGVYTFVNVKFGSIYKTPDHPHPLLFTQGILSDGDCNRCERQLRYKMIFKCLKCTYAVHYKCASA